MFQTPNPLDEPYRRQVQDDSWKAHEKFVMREGFSVQPARGRIELPADYWEKYNAALKASSHQ